MKQTEDGENIPNIADQAIREMLWLATGREVAADHKVSIADLTIPITQTLINRLAVLSLATLAYKARRGSEKASIYLCDRALGIPEMPFREKVRDVTIDGAREMIAREFEESLNLSPDLAASMADKMISGSE